METLLNSLDYGNVLLALVTDQGLFLKSECRYFNKIERRCLKDTLIIHAEELLISRNHFYFRIKIPEQGLHQFMKTVENGKSADQGKRRQHDSSHRDGRDHVYHVVALFGKEITVGYE